ncbi:MAG: KTSC domain-containing protein [Chitinophagaceae bacterium]|nr:KTSC domain-containing protein [Chitinophagaceae bacterium]
MPSTVIRSFHYNAESRILQVRFRSGAIYEYLEVPERIYQDMKVFFSKGKFLNNYIKEQFEFRKIR